MEDQEIIAKNLRLMESQDYGGMMQVLVGCVRFSGIPPEMEATGTLGFYFDNDTGEIIEFVDINHISRERKYCILITKEIGECGKDTPTKKSGGVKIKIQTYPNDISATARNNINNSITVYNAKHDPNDIIKDNDF